ncbi:GyrI-like domain-containing protein [Meiothermus hypogaeus]|uniref:Integron-associated effector binding protein n=2 Tax=Meiothermus hypogaeus TaxID=884155 RepID=A0ABX9MND5_9DEIN|nr:GyrI-like domain-containing protein [Meiothermus hypogaeus]RIH78836.1 Integron-associated effector binding protein [Meiothermus hypogaeus]GEM84161.1 putative transcriptional regulator protein YobU [Meiothermus hypogaeus NBRC 106114]
MDKPVRTRESGFFVAGYEVRTSLALEQNPQTAKIPALWEKIERGELELLIPKRLAKGKPFGVYYNYAPEGSFSVLLGYQVMGQDDVPPGLSGLNVPGGWYLMFTAQGASPARVAQTWQHIRTYFAQSGAPQRAYTFDYEVYENSQRVSIFVAVR